MYCLNHDKVYCSKCCDGLHYKCDTQELCKISRLIDARNIAIDTIKAMEDYVRVYNAESTINNFKHELEILNSKMQKLTESIKLAMNANDFTKYEGFKREVRQ
jgi:predicted nucleic acid-binding OB-fold protein